MFLFSDAKRNKPAEASVKPVEATVKLTPRAYRRIRKLRLEATRPLGSVPARSYHKPLSSAAGAALSEAQCEKNALSSSVNMSIAGRDAS